MKKQHLKNPVFLISASVISILVVIGAILPGRFGAVAQRLFLFTTTNFGWFYLIAVFAIILFLIGISISKYGRIRLGGENEKPEFPFFTWIGMLFSTGFGAGLVFWGVAEPMSHFFETPFASMEGQTETAARVAMGYSFFHWGISQWSVFAIVGLAIAFMQFRKRESGLISKSMEPITGNKKVVKTSIDSLAVIATVMGVATSVGLGVLQIHGGLSAVFDVSSAIWVQIAIIAVIFIAYTASATTGLNKGIRYLSNLNLALCFLLLIFVFLMGPTVFILNAFTLGLGDYITNFIQYSLRLEPYVGGTWVRDWTIFYWAWAISWSPFVGAFVARVSRGRTIREFIAGVMVVPPAIACFWIATFGGTALYKDLNENAGIAEAVNNDITVALFQVFDSLPMSFIMSVLAILLIFTFLITSADSASYILASMTTKGSLVPPTYKKIVWGVLMSGIAAVLLIAGGLDALQTASLVAAVPFTVILLIMLASIFKMLKKELIPISRKDIRRYERIEKLAEKEKSKKKD
ncbi:BCCT family transporter [Oceanobacillus luteolus]|uniref:BCCT family transporter n=1 Tax=Oceanobacillus luteolus TaxID=1274358 RepID=A0ABW4HVS9_9BACI